MSSSFRLQYEYALFRKTRKAMMEVVAINVGDRTRQGHFPAPPVCPSVISTEHPRTMMMIMNCSKMSFQVPWPHGPHGPAFTGPTRTRLHFRTSRDLKRVWLSGRCQT